MILPLCSQTKPELVQLELLSQEFALTKCCTKIPESVPAMLKALFVGFDRDILAKKAEMQQGIKGALDRISAALQVQWEDV